MEEEAEAAAATPVPAAAAGGGGIPPRAWSCSLVLTTQTGFVRRATMAPASAAAAM